MCVCVSACARALNRMTGQLDDVPENRLLSNNIEPVPI